MFSSILVKLSFASLSSIGVVLGGYFVYDSISEKKTEVLGENDKTVSVPKTSKKTALELHTSTTDGKTTTCVFCGFV